MKNKRGFTLVELLVVIVILGVITGLSVPLIRNAQESMKKKKYTTYLESLKTSAKLYNDSYSEDLFGHRKSGVKCVSYEELADKKLVKDISIDNVSCAHNGTFVRITKINDKYVYVPYLECISDTDPSDKTILPEGHTDSTEFCTSNVASTITIATVSKYDKYKTAVFDKKQINTQLEIHSVTPLSSNIRIRAKWVDEAHKDDKSDTGWSDYIKFEVGSRDEQTNRIMNGETTLVFQGDKKFHLSGDNVTGKYYLRVKVDQLMDYDNNQWAESEDGYISIGPYYIDNTPPNITNLKVVTTQSGYNSLPVKVEFDADDKYNNITCTPTNKLKMCISQTEYCNNYSSTYTKSSNLTFSGSYDGKTRKVYVSVKDLAGNEAKAMNESYRVGIKHTLTYDSNGGNACSPTTKEVIHNVGDGRKWGDLCTPSRTGYTFTGWNTAANGSGTTITKDSVIENNIKVYAQWRKNHVYIKINMNGGSLSATHGSGIGTNGNNITVNSSVNVHSIEYGSKLSSDGLINYDNPSYVNIVRNGYKAVANSEWTSGSKNYNQSTAYSASDFCDASKGDCTVELKVNWKVNVCTINFSPNGGSFGTNSNNRVQKLNYGDRINDFWNANGGTYSATRTGYHIDGSKAWILSGGSTTFNEASGYNATDICTNLANGSQSVTLNANWIINTYTLTYNNNGGSGCSSVTKNYGQSWGTLCTPSRTGYSFTGWTHSCGSTATGNCTATANWKKNTFTLTYNNNGGSGCSSITKGYGESWGTLCTPSRSCYTFTGWTHSCGTTATKNCTATANWKINTYTLTYKLNGGTGCASSITKNCGQSWGTLCTPTRTGYNFNGWSHNCGSTATGNCTATANWSAKNGWELSNPGVSLTSQKWIYWNNGSRIQSGWHELYVSGTSGPRATYYFESGYAWCNGWWKSPNNGHWYFLGNTDLDNNGSLDCRMYRNESRQINGTWYHFDNDGACDSPGC